MEHLFPGPHSKMSPFFFAPTAWKTRVLLFPHWHPSFLSCRLYFIMIYYFCRKWVVIQQTRNSLHKMRTTCWKITKVIGNSTDSWKQLNWLSSFYHPGRTQRGTTWPKISFWLRNLNSIQAFPQFPPLPPIKVAGSQCLLILSHFFHMKSRRGV